jgi:CRP-like cAMP-binding protein
LHPSFRFLELIEVAAVFRMFGTRLVPAGCPPNDSRAATGLFAGIRHIRPAPGEKNGTSWVLSKEVKTMYLKQSDLFWGIEHDFVKKVMDVSSKASRKAGETLFREGDPAERFYILIKGRVRLGIGGVGQTVHTVNHPGECFGWSSLIERDVYTASAECAEPTELTVIGREDFKSVLEKDPKNGVVFLGRLAGLIAQRLVNSYRMLSSAHEGLEEGAPGTGQLERTVEKAEP